MSGGRVASGRLNIADPTSSGDPTLPRIGTDSIEAEVILYGPGTQE